MTFRSLLFVPGNNPKFIEKAKGLSSDIICLDLEDSVALNDKQAAREIIRETLRNRKDFRTSNLFVRVNSWSSFLFSDLRVIVNKGIDGIVIPKVNSKEEITYIAHIIADLEERRGIDQKHIKLIPSIESSESIRKTYEISISSNRVCAIVFGIFDYLFSMGQDYEKGNTYQGIYARAKVPAEAKAAGVESIDGIWQDIKDLEGLKKDAEFGKSLGYSGKSIIHPTHLDIVNRTFSPSENQIAWAEMVKEALKDAIENGKGKAAVKLDGRMIDAVHYKQARLLLDRVNKEKK